VSDAGISGEQGHEGDLEETLLQRRMEIEVTIGAQRPYPIFVWPWGNEEKYDLYPQYH